MLAVLLTLLAATPAAELEPITDVREMHLVVHEGEWSVDDQGELVLGSFQVWRDDKWQRMEWGGCGTGVGTTVNEVITAVERVSGRPVKRAPGARRPGDPASLVASAAKAKRVLGWQPTRSSIDNIVASAWRWHLAKGA